MNKIKLTCLLAFLTGVFCGSAQVPAVLNVNYGIDPVLGWQTNGTVVEAVHFGPNLQPCTVNGITFATNASVTVVSGATGTYYSQPYNPFMGNSWYTGSDADQQNLYWNWMDCNGWTSPYYIGIEAPSITVGHVYRLQVALGIGWEWTDMVIGASKGGSELSYYGFLGTNDTEIDSITWTWTATNSYGGLFFYPDNNEQLLFGYTLMDLSSGPPVIYADTTVTPTNTIVAGNPVAFSAAAYGQLPLYYQWRKNGTNIVGATNATYSIASSVTNNAGNYALVVSNSINVATSSVIALTVYPYSRPVITSQPVSASRLQHSRYSFVAGLYGTPPFTNTWTLNGTNYPGATNSTLTLSDIQLSDAGTYVFHSTNSLGGTNSTAVTLNISSWDLAKNPQFGDFGGSVTNASFSNWNTEYGGGHAGSGLPFSTNGCPTWADAQGLWESIYQDTGISIQPNTTYNLTATLWSPTTTSYGTACYLSLEDSSSSAYQTNYYPGGQPWTILNTNNGYGDFGYLQFLYNAPKTNVTVSFNSTNLYGPGHTNSVVGHNLIIRFRNDGEDTHCYVANVILSAIGPATLSGSGSKNVTNYYFTINSWPSNSYYVLSTTNLATGNWITNATITNNNGAYIFTETNAITNRAKFYRVKQK